ncbi:hypothetical protein [Petrotoga halophila]|uniref:Uncharacterized protein n=1 Tax=Petrotoga halophila DSM 16923 TaxID=1122953 RepID=A0A2S5EJF1_9BACT|nr:hypothetical protein [Petrotoga halophila]POZ93233.1 hypothetical protein AA81_02900 [Petrotoga halophila DSM 16923]
MKILDPVFKPLLIKPYHQYREKLLNSMINNKSKNYILIKAPSGYGKSITFSMYFDKLNESKVWISCPQDYFDFDIFLNHLIYTLSKTINLKIFDDDSKNNISFFSEEEKVVELLNAFSSFKEEIFIFVDSFENVMFEGKNENLLKLLLNFIPQNVHFLFTTNQEFPIPLTKFAMANNVYTIQEEELKFSFDELKNYISTKKINLSEENLLELYQLTDGIPTFINILATYIETTDLKKYDELIDSAKKIDEYINLLTEVLSEDLREYLKVFSLMNEIEPKICKAYFNIKSDEKIHESFEKLYDLNMIEKKDPHYYYMNEIFRRTISKGIGEREKSDIYQTLFNIYQKEQDYYGQFHCLLNMKDLEKAYDFFLNHSELLIKDFSIIKKWLDSIPTSFFTNNIELYYYRGVIEEKYSMFDEALADYRMVKDSIHKISDKSILENIDTQIIGIYWHQEKYEKVIEMGNELLKSIPNENYQSLTSLYNLLGTSYSNLSKLDEGKLYLNKAMELCERFNYAEMKPWLLNNLAYNIFLIEGNLESAEKYFIKSLKNFEDSKDLYGKALLNANLTDFYIETQKYDKAKEHLKAFENIYLETKNIAYLPVLKILQAKLEVEKNELNSAQKSLMEAENYSSRSKFLQANYYFVQSLYLLKKDELKESFSTVEKAIKIAKTIFNEYQILNFELQKVRLLIHLKQFEKALSHIGKIIQIATEGKAKLILTEALLLKLFLSKSFNLSSYNEDLKTFNELLSDNNYQFILQKYPEITSSIEDLIKINSGVKIPSLDASFKLRFEASPEISYLESKKALYPKIYLFGEFRLVCGDKVLTMRKVRNQKALELFKFLTLNYDQWIIQDLIIENFWPNLPFEKSRQSLYVALHDIRKRFQEFGLVEEYILQKNRNYKFNVNKVYYLDYEDFILHFEEGNKSFKNKQYLKAKEHYLKAKKLYSYGLLPSNIYDDWAIPKIEDAEKSYLSILAILYSLEKEKDIETAENYLDEYLRIEPFADEMNIEYINLLLKKGERKKALDYYKYINELYKKELGTAFNSKEISYFVKEFQIY